MSDDDPGLTLPALFVCCLFSLPVWALLILAVGGDLMRELFIMAALTFGIAAACGSPLGALGWFAQHVWPLLF